MALRVYLSPDACDHPVASALASRLEPLPSSPASPCLVVELHEDRLQLRNPASRELPWYVDFAGARHTYRRSRGGGVKQHLARAVGIKGQERPRVVDATAGWGRDAFVLASLGCSVDMMERHPVVAALLDDGLRRAGLDRDLGAIARRMRLHVLESSVGLPELATTYPPDTVYLDPMYPEAGKSAAVKKELRLLRELLDESGDGADLLDVACDCAGGRVTVKRPKAAPFLAGRKPDAQIASANTRYDVYFTGKQRRLGEFPQG